MAKIIKTSAEKVSEFFKCPYCSTIFEAKAEDITDFSPDTTQYVNTTVYKFASLKCPYCTNKLRIDYRECDNIYLKKAFYPIPDEAKSFPAYLIATEH